MSGERVLVPTTSGSLVAGTLTDSHGYIVRVVGDDDCIYWVRECELRPIRTGDES